MEIELYERMRGDCPVGKFISDLPLNHQKKVYKKIERLKEDGLHLSLRTKIVKKLGRNIYELIINYDGMFYRILFTIIKDAYWLISAFKKKSNKTPSRELAKAIKIKKQLEK